MEVSAENLVDAVRALEEAARGRSSPFHLNGCGCCGAPTYAYPCPNCRNWCDFSDTASMRAASRAAAERSGAGSRESFVKRVEAAGGIGPWYFSGFRDVVAYGSSPSFAAVVDGAVERARTIAWPDPGEIWDAVKSGAVFPPDGYWRDSLDAFERRAVQEFGDRYHRLRCFREPGPLQSWAENCPEGRKLLQTFGEERLAALAAAPGVARPAA